MKKYRVLLFAAVLAGVSACQSKSDGSAALKDDFFKGLVAEKYVEPFKAGNVDQWISAFDENAIALHDHRPADRGKPSIMEFGKAVHSMFRLDRYDVVVTDIRRSDKWVYTVGKFTTLFVNKSDGEAPWGLNEGKFVLLWELQDNGEWKIILDMGNTSLP